MRDRDSWSIINPKHLKDIDLTSKCELCGIDIKDQLYKDYLRSCIYNISFNNIADFGLFHRTIQLIKKVIGRKAVVIFLNSKSLAFLETFFCPPIEKDCSIYFPIDRITDIITSGLVQQNDKLTLPSIHYKNQIEQFTLDRFTQASAFILPTDPSDNAVSSYLTLHPKYKTINFEALPTSLWQPNMNYPKLSSFIEKSGSAMYLSNLLFQQKQGIRANLENFVLRKSMFSCQYS